MYQHTNTFYPILYIMEIKITVSNGDLLARWTFDSFENAYEALVILEEEIDYDKECCMDTDCCTDTECCKQINTQQETDTQQSKELTDEEIIRSFLNLIMDK